jgi:hypothetical protein
MTSSPQRSSSPLRWVQLALYLAGDVAWIYAWSVTMGAWIDGSDGAPPLELGRIVLLGLTAAILSRLATTRAAPRPARLAIAALGLLVALAIGSAAVGLRPLAADSTWAVLAETTLGWRAFAAIALALLAWWRGIAAGRSSFTVDAVESGFRGGVSALIALFLIALIAGSAYLASPGTLILLAMVVLFTGLLGMPLARILHLGGTTSDPASPPLQVGRQWLGLLLGTILGLLLLAILLSAVLTFERLDRLLSPVVQALQIVVYLIALPLGFLVEGLIYLLRSLLQPTNRLPPPTAPLGRLIDSLRSQPKAGNGPPELLGQILVWSAIALVAALVLWLLARAVARNVERAVVDGVEETREMVWSWEEIQSAIARWFTGWRARRRRQLASMMLRRRLDSPIETVPLTPRELYRELLRIGARAGQRRSVDETPNEYERSLARLALLTNGQKEIHALTGVYVQDRYAAEPPTVEEVDDAREALHRLRDVATSVILEGRPPWPS